MEIALATQGVQDENDLTEDKAIKLLSIFLKTINNTSKNDATSKQIAQEKATTSKEKKTESVSNEKNTDGSDSLLIEL